MRINSPRGCRAPSAPGTNNAPVAEGRRLRRRQGTAVVELAVTLPPLLLLVVGVWEVGRCLEVQQIVNTSAREGAREAVAQKLTSAQIEELVRGYLKAAGLPAKEAAVKVVNLDRPGEDAGSARRGDRIQIEVSLPFRSVEYVCLNFFTTDQTMIVAVSTWCSHRERY